MTMGLTQALAGVTNSNLDKAEDFHTAVVQRQK